MTQYHPIKSKQIKIKNTICIQCGRQSCLMITNGVCPALSECKQKIIKIKEDLYYESLFIIKTTRRKRCLC